MQRTYTLVFFLVATWCALGTAQPRYDVHVDAFPDPDRIIDKSLPICFDSSLIKSKDQSLEAKNTVSDILDVCERVAKLKGLKVMPSSKGRDCLHIGFEWEDSEAERSGNGSSRCWRFYNALFCSTRNSSGKLYGKGLKFYFYDNGFAPPRKVLELQTSMTSENRGFRRNTAEVLCRAAFQDYPKKLKDQSYEVEPKFD